MADKENVNVDNGWLDEKSARLRDAGYKIVRFGEAGIIYVGQVDYNNKPDGTGFMFLRNGDIHQCQFKNGRADGDGLYIGASGTETKGTWQMNKRVGVFHVIDSSGIQWTERYNQEGKKVARKKTRQEVKNPKFEGNDEEPPTIMELAPKDEPCKKCWYCNRFGRERNNHSWACRAHPGKFTEDRTYRGDEPRPGIWSCCGREAHHEPGCAFRTHYFMD